MYLTVLVEHTNQGNPAYVIGVSNSVEEAVLAVTKLAELGYTEGEYTEITISEVPQRPLVKKGDTRLVASFRYQAGKWYLAESTSFSVALALEKARNESFASPTV
jgi:16S rRNA C967 or C1407 C5-methylase (RsmB/RsmF family)